MAERFESSEDMIRRAREAARSPREVPTGDPAGQEPRRPIPEAPIPQGHAPRVEHLEVDPLTVPSPSAPPPMPPSGPATPPPPRGRAVVAFVVALVLLGAGFAATQLIDVDDAGDTPATAPISADPEPGTCLRDPGGGFAALEPVDCARSHDLEVFAIVDLPYGSDEPIPEDDELFDIAFQACLDRFSSYTNEAWEDSPFYIRTYVPDRRGWRAGDRSVVCTLFAADADGQPVPSTGSAAGTDA